MVVTHPPSRAPHLLLPLLYDNSAIARHAVPLLKGKNCKQIHEYLHKLHRLTLGAAKRGNTLVIHAHDRPAHSPFRIHAALFKGYSLHAGLPGHFSREEGEWHWREHRKRQKAEAAGQGHDLKNIQIRRRQEEEEPAKQTEDQR